MPGSKPVTPGMQFRLRHTHHGHAAILIAIRKPAVTLTDLTVIDTLSSKDFQETLAEQISRHFDHLPSIRNVSVFLHSFQPSPKFS